MPTISNFRVIRPGLPPQSVAPVGQLLRPQGNYADNVPGWMRALDTGLRNLKIPKFNFAENIQNPVGRFAAGMGEGLLNIVPNALDVLTRDYGVNYAKEPRKLISRLADAGMTGLDIGGLMVGVPGASKIGQQVGKAALPQLMKQGAMSFGKMGAGFGAAYGGLNAIREQQAILPGVAMGGVLGAGMMGAIGAASPAIGAASRMVFPRAALKAEMGAIEGVENALTKDVNEVMLRKQAAAKLNLGGNIIEDPLGAGAQPSPGLRQWESGEPRPSLKEWKSGVASDVNPTLKYVDPLTGDVSAERAVSEIVPRFPGKGLLESPIEKMPWGKKIITSGETAVKRMGEAGRVFAGLSNEEERLIAQNKARFSDHVADALNKLNKRLAADTKGLSRKEAEVHAQGVMESIDKAVRTDELKWLSRSDEAELAQAMKNMFDDVKQEALNKKINTAVKGGKEIPWMPRKNYAPKYYSDKVLNSIRFREMKIAEFLRTGEATGPRDAAILFEEYKNRQLLRRAGHLEYQRASDDQNFIKDPRAYLPMYIDDVSRRLGEISIWGQKLENLETILKKMEAEGYDSEVARQVFEAKYPQGDASKVYKLAQDFQMATKLPLSGPLNLTQSQNTIASHGFKNVGKTLLKWIKGSTATREEMRGNATLAGAYDRLNITDEMGTKTNWFRDASLYVFKKTETFNRWLAANSGIERAKELSKILISGTASEKKVAMAIRRLDALGIDSRALLSGKQKELTAAQMAAGAWYGSKNTQFTISGMSVPSIWRTPVGKLITQFKSFPFMQTKFIRDEIAKEAAMGNLAPAMRFMSTMAVSYYSATWFLDQVKGTKPPTNEQQKQVNQISDLLRMTGTLPADILSSALYSAQRMYGENSEYTTDLEKALMLAGNFLGPTVSDAGQLHAAAYTSGELQKENIRERPEDQINPYWYPYGKYLAPKIPYVGPKIKNTLFGEFPLRQREAQAKAYQAALKAGDPGMLEEALQIDPSISGINRLQAAIRAFPRENMSPEEKAVYEEIEKTKADYLNAPIL